MKQFRTVPKYIAASESADYGVRRKVRQLDCGDYFADEPNAKASAIKEVVSIDVETRGGLKVYRIDTPSGEYYYDPTDIVYVYDPSSSLQEYEFVFPNEGNLSLHVTAKSKSEASDKLKKIAKEKHYNLIGMYPRE